MRGLPSGGRPGPRDFDRLRDSAVQAKSLRSRSGQRHNRSLPARRAAPQASRRRERMDLSQVMRNRLSRSVVALAGGMGERGQGLQHGDARLPMRPTVPAHRSGEPRPPPARRGRSPAICSIASSSSRRTRSSRRIASSILTGRSPPPPRAAQPARTSRHRPRRPGRRRIAVVRSLLFSCCTRPVPHQTAARYNPTHDHGHRRRRFHRLEAARRPGGRGQKRWWSTGWATTANGATLPAPARPG